MAGLSADFIALLLIRGSAIAGLALILKVSPFHQVNQLLMW
jgi:hypothetical protein